MSVVLKVNHIDDLVLRQQSAHNVERTHDGVVVKGTEWKFENEPCKQDEDQRRVDAEGKHIKLGTYTVYLTAGLKNVVIEKSGATAHVDFRNSSLRNQLRIRYQRRSVKPASAEGKVTYSKWENSGQPQYIPPNTWTGVSVDKETRAIVDEMPT